MTKNLTPILLAICLAGANLLSAAEPASSPASNPGNSTSSPAAKLRRPISNTNPMFLILIGPKCAEKSSATDIWPLIPDDLKPYCVFYIAHCPLLAANKMYDAELGKCDKLGAKAFIQTRQGKGPIIPDAMAFVEKMYQEHPSFLGPLLCEWSGDTLDEFINLSAVHGGYTLHMTFRGLMKTKAMKVHPENYIFMAKQNMGKGCAGPFYPVLVNHGKNLWEKGLCGNWGPAQDSWCWLEMGRTALYSRGKMQWGFRNSMTYPEAQVSMVLLQCAIEGATVFGNFEDTETQTFMNGKTMPCFDKEIVPTLRDIITKRLIPPKEVVLSRVKATGLTSGFAESGMGRRYLRSQSAFIERADLGAKIDQQNPVQAVESKGDAFAQNFLGNKWYVHNSNENEDKAQQVALTPQVNTVDGIDFTLPPHTYAVIVEDKESVDFRIGNYVIKKDELWSGPDWGGNSQKGKYRDWLLKQQAKPDDSYVRTTIVTFRGTEKPSLTIKGYNGYTGFTHTDKWDEAKREYVLSITHNGSVLVTVKAKGTNKRTGTAVQKP